MRSGRHVALVGGSKGTPNLLRLARALGLAFAAHKEVILVTGGAKERTWDRTGQHWHCTDWAAVEGFRAGLEDQGLLRFEQQRIETLLPDPGAGASSITRFTAGKVVQQQGKGAQARRFAMVELASVVVSLGGSAGTGQMMELALAIQRPLLPLPFAARQARQWWKENRPDIQDHFALHERPEITARWERTRLGDLDESNLATLAEEVADVVTAVLQRTVFIAMPFAQEHTILYDNVLDPAARAVGFEPYRTDRTPRLGDIVTEIREQVRVASCVIAVLSELNPNVFWELGLADAMHKDVVLLCRRPTAGIELPFDVSTRKVFFYDDPAEATEQARLRELVEQVLAGLEER